MSVFQREENRLKYRYDAELLAGVLRTNSLQVQATKEAEMPKRLGASGARNAAT